MIFNIDKLMISLGKWFNRENSPSSKQVVKESIVGRDIVAGDKYEASSPTLLSKLEKQILKFLYNKHSNNNEYPREKLIYIFEQLNVKEGTFVGPINDSKFLKVEGEDILMTSDGLRYMDNLTDTEIKQIILPAEQKLIDEKRRIQEQQIEEYRKRMNNQRSQWE